MRLTQPEIESMQEDMTTDILAILMEERQMSMQEAMLLFYNSDTYSRLQDAGSGMYYQSNGYVLDCLDSELTTGKCN